MLLLLGSQFQGMGTGSSVRLERCGVTVDLTGPDMAIDGGQAKDYHGAGICDWHGRSQGRQDCDSTPAQETLRSTTYISHSWVRSGYTTISVPVQLLWDSKLQLGSFSTSMRSATDVCVYCRSFPTLPRRCLVDRTSDSGVAQQPLQARGTTRLKESLDAAQRGRVLGSRFRPRNAFVLVLGLVLGSRVIAGGLES